MIIQAIPALEIMPFRSEEQQNIPDPTAGSASVNSNKLRLQAEHRRARP